MSVLQAGLESQQGQVIFLSSKMSRPSLLLNGHQGLFPQQVEWPGSEADHWSPSTAKVKNGWIYTSIPSICLHGGYKDKFIFLPLVFSLYSHLPNAVLYLASSGFDLCKLRKTWWLTHQKWIHICEGRAVMASKTNDLVHRLPLQYIFFSLFNIFSHLFS